MDTERASYLNSTCKHRDLISQLYACGFSQRKTLGKSAQSNWALHHKVGSSKAQEKYFRAKTPFVLAFSTGPVFRFDHPDMLEI